MAEAIAIAAEARDRAGKGAARAARRAGMVPGVIYGESAPPTMININVRTVQRLVRDPAHLTHLYMVEVDGAQHKVLCRDVQYHPVTDDALHLDFLRVGDKTEITVDVPVQFVNEDKSPGLKRGGVLNIVRHEIEMDCLAGSIPDHITVDLSGWDVGDTIHISAIALPAGVRPTITDRDFTVATIGAPSGMKSEGAGDADEEAGDA